MNEVAASIISIVILFLVFITASIMGINWAEDSYKTKLHNVGIERIEHHYVETDGVRSNWYEIVWMDSHKKTSDGE